MFWARFEEEERAFYEEEQQLNELQHEAHGHNDNVIFNYDDIDDGLNDNIIINNGDNDDDHNNFEDDNIPEYEVGGEEEEEWRGKRERGGKEGSSQHCCYSGVIHLLLKKIREVFTLSVNVWSEFCLAAFTLWTESNSLCE